MIGMATGIVNLVDLMKRLLSTLQQLLPSSRYKILTIDLTEAHEDEEYDLEEEWGLMVVLRCDDPNVYIKFNRFDQPMIRVDAGNVIPIRARKIFVTNPASTTAGARLELLFLKTQTYVTFAQQAFVDALLTVLRVDEYNYLKTSIRPRLEVKDLTVASDEILAVPSGAELIVKDLTVDGRFDVWGVCKVYGTLTVNNALSVYGELWVV